EIGKAPRALVRDGEAAGKSVGRGAAFLAAGRAARAPDRQDAAILAAHHAAREREIDRRADVVAGASVAGQTAAVDEHRRARLAVERREALHVGAGQA